MNERTHTVSPNVVFHSPLRPDTNPCCSCRCVKQYSTYAPNKMATVSLYLLGEHASFFSRISTVVLVVIFVEIWKQMQ